MNLNRKTPKTAFAVGFGLGLLAIAVMGAVSVNPGGSGGGADGTGNWTAVGSTNSSLAGQVRAHSANFTNSVTINGATRTNWPDAGFSGAVSNAVASAGLLSVDSSKTNGIAATPAHVIAALGYTPANSDSVSGVANPTGTIGLTAVNGSAVSAIRSDGAPALSQAIVPTWTGLHTFSAAALVTDLQIGGLAVSRGTLTHGANVLIDFGITNRYSSCSLTGNVTFVFNNVAAGKWYNVLLTMPATNCTPTFPFTGALTNWFGGAPSTLTGGTIGTLSFFARDTTTNGVVAAYAETQ